MAAILLGTLMRLVWLDDMEWKSDEIWMFQKAQEIQRTGNYPPIGMPSGAGGLVNPGLSVWSFAFLAKVARTPVAMNAWIAGLNALTLFLFLAFISSSVPKEERREWFWALALMAVSVLPVLFSRKIWAQCLLPLFSFVVLFGHWHRKKIWGALVFGLFGALIGQLHMSGFFFAGGLVLATLVWDYRRQNNSGEKFPLSSWLWILGGMVLGSLALLPWLQHLSGGGTTLLERLKNILSFKFYTHGLATAWGLDIREYLGVEFDRFIREPYFFGKASYGVLLAHFILAIFAINPLLKWTGEKIIYLTLKRKFPSIQANESPFGKNRLAPRTRFYLAAAFWGMGILLTLTGLNLKAHYLIVLYPILFLLVPVFYPGRNRILLLILFLQFFISVNFLGTIHKNGGAPGGDYGKSYRVQMEGVRK
ncbi:MAG: hypothetical protein JNM63_05710 [Spirochaetia bacterium]|nr:hypothetical protein [Spirochaetia bacterium]